MTNVKENQKAWIVVFAAGLYFFYEYIQMTMFNSISSELLKDFNISAYQLGKLSSAYFISQLILLLPAGILLDRFSIKKLILAVMMCSIVGTLILSFTHSYNVAFLARFLSGIGGAFAFLGCIKLASRWFLPSKLSLVISLIITLALAGGFFAQTPLAWANNHISWRASLRGLVVLGVIIWGIVLVAVTDHPARSEKDWADKIANTGFFESLFLSIKNVQTFLGGFYICFMNLPVFLLGSLWGGLYLEETRGLSNIHATFISSMLFLGLIVGTPLFGLCSDKVFRRRKPPMYMGAILSLLTILGILYLPDLGSEMLILLFFFLGFFSSSQCIGYSCIVENNDGKSAATASGIASIIIMGGGALSKIFYGGILVQHWNGEHLDGIPIYSFQAFHAAMLILPTAFVLAILTNLFIRETRCKATKNQS